jgi:DNA-binding SARP family transcriptional activator
VTQIRILGPLEAKVDGEPVTLGPPKQRLLLALLALHANEVVARDRIVDVLWPDDPPAQPANAVQVYVHGLRTRLGRQRISRRGTGYLLEVTADELDSLKFAELVASARVAHAASETARARRLLSQALAHWRGEPLADLDAENLAADRALLAEAKLAALELRIDVDLAHGELAAGSTRVEWLSLQRPDDAIWIAGGPHIVVGPTAPPRLAGNVLLWQHGGLTYRLEGRRLTRDRAVALARAILGG